MTFQEKNSAVSLTSFLLILGFFSLRVFQLQRGGQFDSEHVFRLFGTVVVFAVIGTVLAIMATHLLPQLAESIRRGDKDIELDMNDFSDERDRMIDLRGTKLTYTLSSLGGFFAMLTFVFGYSPLVMFTLLIFFGVLAQIAGDLQRLYLYRTGI